MELITDNVSEFTSNHSKISLKIWGFKHQPVRPHYHKSTGLVKRSIQTVNFEKCKTWSMRRILWIIVFKITTQWKWKFSSQKII